MLQKIREGSQGWITWLIVGLISLTFIAIGTGSFMSSQAGSEVLAKVGGTKITKAEVDKLVRRLANQPHKTNLDPKLMATQALQALIANATLVNVAHEQGFKVGPQQVGQFISQLPDFQENGKFSSEKYKNVLYQIGYADSEFHKEIQSAILIDQLRQGLRQSAFILPKELATAINFEDQKRDFDFMLIPNAIFEKDLKISDAQINTYYKANLNQFLTPEKIKVEYLELKASPLENMTQEVQDEFSNKADELIKLAYEYSDSLAPAADKLGLTIQTSPFLSRENNVELFNDPKIMAAVFGQELLGGMNSDVIQKDANHYMVFRLVEHEKPKQKALLTVKSEIEKILLTQGAAKKSASLALNLVNDLKKGGSINDSELIKSYHLKWESVKETTRAYQTLPVKMIEEAFSLPKPLENKISANQFVLTPDYQAVVLLTKVTDGKLSDLDPQRRQVLEEQLANHFSQIEFELFAKNHIKVKS